MTTNCISRATLTIDLGNGDVHTYVVNNPSPAGSNPRFMGQQLQKAMEVLGNRARDLMDSYAPQIEPGQAHNEVYP